MDWKSHILIGILFALLFKILEPINIFLFVLGSVLPDLSVILFSIYFKFDKNKLLNAFTNNKEKPKSLFIIYNSLHSFFLVIILLALSFQSKSLVYLAAGIFLHILIDIPLHKDHAIKPFYPLKWRFKYCINWWDFYGKDLKSRIIVWAIITISIILAWIITH